MLHVPSVSFDLILLSQWYLRRRTNYEISHYAVFFSSIKFFSFTSKYFSSSPCFEKLIFSKAFVQNRIFVQTIWKKIRNLFIITIIQSIKWHTVSIVPPCQLDGGVNENKFVTQQQLYRSSTYPTHNPLFLHWAVNHKLQHRSQGERSYRWWLFEGFSSVLNDIFLYGLFPSPKPL